MNAKRYITHKPQGCWYCNREAQPLFEFRETFSALRRYFCSFVCVAQWANKVSSPEMMDNPYPSPLVRVK